MKRRIITLTAALLCLIVPSRAQNAPPRDLFADTWAATDALGRALPTAADARPARKNRFVGIFYFLWHGGHGTPGPFDISQLLAANPDLPAWGPPGAFHWWGQPAVGYFRADDPWVIRRNLSLLADADVDVLLCDVTNAFTYPEEVRALCAVARQMRRAGNKTPQIAFVTHAHSADTVARLYSEVYAQNLCPELWFRWRGKPLLLGPREAKRDDGTELDPKIRDFFTWRDSWAWEPGQDKWPWIENTPQKGGWHENPKELEEVPVAVAGHPTSNLGRSYENGKEPPLDKFGLADARSEGRHFAEQWKRALELDPLFVFVDGWNEWVAQRFVSGTGGGPDFLGRKLKPGETFFVDAYNAEFSRDIEPMADGYGDNYYFQLVAGVRKFKGVRPAPPVSQTQTIKLDGGFRQWQTVTPEYRDTIGDTTHRDWGGWGTLHYKNATGRNDIVTAKVARDAKFVYFYAQTQAALSPRTGPHWMQLLLDADQNARTGWGGYDFIIADHPTDARTTTLRRLSDGKTWRIEYRATGRELMLAVPRVLLGRAFDFHWADNAPVGGDMQRLWMDGDSAPNGRFNYRCAFAPTRKMRP